MVIQGLTIIAAALLNRFRGGGLWADKIPVKALWLTMPLIGALAFYFHGSLTLSYPFQGFWTPVAFAVAFLMWAILPWGRWFDHGRMTLPTRTATPYEEGIENMAIWICHKLGIFSYRAIDILSHFFRQMMIIPALALLALVTGKALFIYLGLPLALLIVAMYEIGWIMYDSNKVDNPIEIAEYLVGIMWGALIAFS